MAFVLRGNIDTILKTGQLQTALAKQSRDFDAMLEQKFQKKGSGETEAKPQETSMLSRRREGSRGSFGGR